MNKLRLNEINSLISLQKRLQKISLRISERGDIDLLISDNGTVCDNIDCAIASLETILQEY